MSKKANNESAADLIIKAIKESDDQDKATETAIQAIFSFLLLQEHKKQARCEDSREHSLSIAG